MQPKTATKDEYSHIFTDTLEPQESVVKKDGKTVIPVTDLDVETTWKIIDNKMVEVIEAPF